MITLFLSILLQGSVFAQSVYDNLPLPWNGRDVGATGPAGSGAYNSGTARYTVTGSGADIWNERDAFHFSYFRLVGDGEIVARVESISSPGGVVDGWAKCGVMMRQGLEETDTFAAMLVTPGNGIHFQKRDRAWSSAVDAASTAGTAPNWVRLVRTGSVIRGYVSANGTSWGSAMGEWQATAKVLYVGLCVCGHNNAQLTQAVFSNVSAVAGEKALRADSFVDSIGVGFESNDQATTTIARARLAEMNIRHVRIGIRTPDYANQIKQMATTGQKSLFLLQLGNGPIDINNGGYPIGPPYNGTITDVQGWRDTVKQINTQAGGLAIEAVEGANEPDIFWHRWYNCTYNGKGFFQTVNGTYQGVTNLLKESFEDGPTQMQRDIFQVFNADSATAPIDIFGSCLGLTYDPGAGNPWPTGDQVNYADRGNLHAYPGSNPFSFPETYDTIAQVWNGNNFISGYTWSGSHPGNNLVYAMPMFTPPFLGNSQIKPMVMTETGYFTGTGNSALTQKTFTKYVPRIFTENFLNGITRSYYFTLVDWTNLPNGPGENRGLLYYNGDRKPAFYATRDLIGLLSEGAYNNTTLTWNVPAFTPGTLAYTVKPTAVNNYTEPNSGVVANWNRDWNVHHLLLQKATGEFYLLLWHEVASSSRTQATTGAAINGIQRDIDPPAMPTTVELPASIGGAHAFEYDNNGYLIANPAGLPIATNATTGKRQVQVNVSDKVMAIRLTPQAILPDMIVTNVTWSPANPQPGQAVTFTATIKNQGQTGVPAGTVTGIGYNIDTGTGNAVFTWSATADAIAPGQSLTVTGGTWTAGANGVHTLAVSADDVNRYAETSETNNTINTTITVGGMANSGTGLRGKYYANKTLTGSPTGTRTDGTVNFGWGTSAPGVAGVGADNYSVAWEGQVEAPTTGTYTFSTRSDDGVRLYVNGIQVVNNWTDHSVTDDYASTTLQLSAGQRVSIRMEYYESTGNAEARLYWAYPGQARGIIPQTRLYPATN